MGAAMGVLEGLWWPPMALEVMGELGGTGDGGGWPKITGEASQKKSRREL